MTRPARFTMVCLLLALGAGCAGGVHDRQVLSPSRDWRVSDARRERVARLKAPFVRLGERLRSVSDPTGPPALSVQPLEEPDAPVVDGAVKPLQEPSLVPSEAGNR